MIHTLIYAPFTRCTGNDLLSQFAHVGLFHGSGSQGAFLSVCVLGSARIGLIFTRSWEQGQPGWLTQTGQTNGIFDTMCRHAGFRWGSWPGGSKLWFRSALGIGQQELLCAVL